MRRGRYGLVLAACVAASAEQSLNCEANYQCYSGYCDLNTQLCKECLLCEDYRRLPPPAPVACITSVSKCGACFEGLVEDASGDLQAACAPAGGGGALPYVCAAAALGLLLFIGVVVYVLRHKHVFRQFRLLASTTTSVQSPCTAVVTASAPEPPPPYNTLYSPVRPESPPAPPPTHYEESPFLKQPPTEGAAREAAARQAANMFHRPAYVRGPHLPAEEPAPAREPEPEFLQDDSTAQSDWTPDAPRDDQEAGAGAGSAAGPALPALLEAARGAVLVRAPDAPPAKVPRLHQDSNNNRGARSRPREEDAARGAPTFNIHVNVQQLNDVKL